MTSLEGWDSAIELRPQTAQGYLQFPLGQGVSEGRPEARTGSPLSEISGEMGICRQGRVTSALSEPTRGALSTPISLARSFVAESPSHFGRHDVRDYDSMAVLGVRVGIEIHPKITAACVTSVHLAHVRERACDHTERAPVLGPGRTPAIRSRTTNQYRRQAVRTRPDRYRNT